MTLEAQDQTTPPARATLAGNRPFRVFYLGRAVSLTGTAAAPVALAFAVLRMGGSAGDLGWVLAANMLPQVLLLLVGGVVADRLPRVRVMVAANVVAGAGQGVTAGLLLAGAARVGYLIPLAGVTGIASAFFQPAAQGIVPQLVAAGDLRQANATLRLTFNIIKVCGPAASGLVVAAAGPGWAIGWDAVSFFAAAAIMSRLSVPLERTQAAGFLAELHEGWREFASRTWLWVLVAQGSVDVLLWLVGYQLLGPVDAQRSLGGASAWGVVASAFAGGLIAGSSIALKWRPARLGYVVCFGSGSMALPLAAMAIDAPLPGSTLSVN